MGVRLGKLANEFAARAVACERTFDESPPTQARAYSVVRLYAEWEEFSRRLVYTSATRNPMSETGTQVLRPPGVRCEADVDSRIRKLYRKKPGQHFTVAWGTPFQLVKVSTHLDLSNKQTINPAIQSVDSPADELRKLRNFIAHRNASTARQVVLMPGMGAVGVDRVLNWLADRQPGGRSRFGVWCGDLIDVAQATVQ